MIKNIMGAAIAVALAVGIGTTGVRSIAADTSLVDQILMKLLNFPQKTVLI